MTNGQIDTFSKTLQRIQDGFVFENFAQEILACVYGREFRPLGGIKDKGIDGEFYEAVGDRRTIYQISIQKTYQIKIIGSVDKLIKNNVEFDRFVYVTNQEVKEQLTLEEEVFERFDKPASIRDVHWLKKQVSASADAMRLYHTFIESHFQPFTIADKEDFFITDISGDPRILVFLRQQWEDHRKTHKLDEVLADSLILLALEGTDPDKGILRNKSEVRDHILGIFPHAKLVDSMLEKRLEKMSSKPDRRVRHHRKEDAYCLPFETRDGLSQKNIEDQVLHDLFFEVAEERLRKHLDVQALKVEAGTSLLHEVFKQTFRRQGLQFSSFVFTIDSKSTFEQLLPDIIKSVVDESNVAPKNRNSVAAAILTTVRDIIYRGSEHELAYLRKLSDTYMMVFLMQGDPVVVQYFSTLASKLRVFVDNSILVPAFSEYSLEPRHQRHWNLLKAAHRAGVQLRINRVTLEELAGHLRRVLKIYNRDFKKQHELYEDEVAIRYVEEILIRAYFYSLRQGKSWSFGDYIECFATPGSNHIEDELLELLREEFGIHYVDDADLGFSFDETELEGLTQELSSDKSQPIHAKNDARTILTIYGLRGLRNERSTGGVFGYHTWWLSKDTSTYDAVVRAFGRKYEPSCYLRPDFLYNFIALAPSLAQSVEIFDQFFPSMLGVSVSHHFDREVSKVVRECLKNHESLPKSRKVGIMRRLMEDLKTDNSLRFPHRLQNYMDEQLRRM